MRWCLFCNRRATSKEHVWPLWLLERLRRAPMATIHSERGDGTRNRWSGKEVTAKFVCAGCNNGWMSELENVVKPVVEPLLLDHNVGLDRPAQTVLAAWAVKNAMVFEALRVAPPWFFTDGERSAFRKSLRPPTRTNVWIAKCVEHSGCFCSAFDMNVVLDEGETTVPAHLTTMAFGSLTIQIAAGKLPHSVPLATTVTLEDTSTRWEEATVRIWPGPLELVNWPRPVHLRGNQGLEALENRWGPHPENDDG